MVTLLALSGADVVELRVVVSSVSFDIGLVGFARSRYNPPKMYVKIGTPVPPISEHIDPKTIRTMSLRSAEAIQLYFLLVHDGINSVADYNSLRVGVGWMDVGWMSDGWMSDVPWQISRLDNF